MESVLLYILGIVFVVVGIGVSIGLHEFGHLIPAKLFGVKVTQYMIGFGKTIFSFRRGETEYGFKLLPLGGYISMIGMFPPAKQGGKVRAASTGFFNTLVQDARTSSAATITEGDEARAFYKLAVWKRVIIMCGGPFMNLVIAVILYAVLLMGFGTVQATTTLSSVSACVLPASSTATTCAADDPEAPGSAAGLLPGDTIESIDGTAITSWDQATQIIRTSAGDPLDVVVLREGKDVSLTATPLLTERYVYDSLGKVEKNADGTDKTQEVGFLGIGTTSELVQQPITSVLPAVGTNITGVASIILDLPQHLVNVANAAFGSGERDPNGPISVVGVGRVAGEIASLQDVTLSSKFATLLGLIASLNVALLVFNLVPLLPLDGGHIIGALWEGLRRSIAKLFKRRDPGPVDMAKLMPVTFAVVIVLVGMSALLVYADIVRPISIQ